MLSMQPWYGLLVVIVTWITWLTWCLFGSKASFLEINAVVNRDCSDSFVSSSFANYKSSLKKKKKNHFLPPSWFLSIWIGGICGIVWLRIQHYHCFVAETILDLVIVLLPGSFQVPPVLWNPCSFPWIAFRNWDLVKCIVQHYSLGPFATRT